MKSKEELKKLFENGDKPTQEEFWEWQDSYWHKDEKLPTEAAGIYKIKGSVANLAALNAITNMEEGDVYNLLDTGDNYVYVLDLNNTGVAGWDKLSGIIDLSAVDLQTVLDNGGFAQSDDTNNSVRINLDEGVYSFNSLDGLYNTALNVEPTLIQLAYNYPIDEVETSSTVVSLRKGGLQYADDYSQRPEFADRNLVDKGYVDAAISNVPQIDTLEDVVSRGNYTPRPIYFVDGDEQYTSLGMNPSTYSFFWGSMAKGHTGEANMAIGYYSMDNLTTGTENNAYGIGSLRNLTTGWRNVSIGAASLHNTTTGFKNTALGINAGTALIDGSLNTVMGYKANNSVNFGDKNIFIGANSAQGVTGSNNIMIGVGAGVNGGALSNKLIIHSNHTLTGYTNTTEGNFTTPQLSYLSNALITGDFAEKWVKINGQISMSPTGITSSVQHTLTNDKDFVQKKHLDDATKRTKGEITTITNVGSGSVNGTVWYEYEENSDYFTVRLDIEGSLPNPGDSCFVTFPFEIGITNQTIIHNGVTLNVYTSDVYLSVQRISEENVPFSIKQCFIIPYGFEATNN